MNPNEYLRIARRSARICHVRMQERNVEKTAEAAAALIEHFEALDNWLSSGNALPDAWLRTSPGFGARPELDELFHDTFVTALEGGIGYWSAAASYHWGDDDGAYDREGFYADIVDAEFPDDADNAYFPPTRIDRTVIARGFDRILGGEIEINPKLRDQIVSGYHAPDHADFDAEVADVIVQVGLFNEIVYG
jgi:hypothetical protein